jgi:hypothetical protein
MTQPSPALRFGIEVDGRRSYTWRVRSGAQHPELFVERENLAAVTHLSLDASGKWHIKAHNRKVYKWVRPAEFTPGYTHALAIVQPVVVATITLPAPTDAQVLKLLKLPDDTEPMHFDLWIERPGANLQSWPGQRAMGTALVGRIPLADGAGFCCVVSRQGPIAPGSITLPKPSEEEIARMLDAAAENRLDGTMVGGLHDGTVVLMDGRFDPDSARVLGLMAAAHRAGPPSG